MIRDMSFGWTALLALGMLLAGAANAQNKSQAAKKKAASSAIPAVSGAKPKIELEPKAIDILKAASSTLAAARTMSFTTVVTYESPSRLGPPLAYTTKSEVTVQRPDKLRVLTMGDGPASQFYYDGKTMMAFAPAENLVAVADAPPTIDAALETAYKSAAIYLPFSDVIVADPYKDIADAGLDLAFYIGQSQVVGGTTTDIVGYVAGGVFLQIWVGVEDKLPRMLCAVYLDDPLQLRHRLEMSNWQIDVDVPANAFVSSSAATATRIKFAHPNGSVPPGAKPKASRTGQ
jgi:hypothetical protein